MQRYTEKIDKMFAKYNIHGLTPPVPIKTPKQLLQRVDFAIDGQRRLNELLNVLKSCNDGLVQIVSPAPAYHDSRSDQTLSSSDLPTQAQYSRIQTQIISPLPSPAIDPDHTQSPSHSTRGELETQPILQLIHSRCTYCLRTIINQNPRYTLDLGHAADQLNLWASGMFTGRITLDQVLRGNSTPKKILRDHIIGTLVDIAMYVGKPCSP